VHLLVVYKFYKPVSISCT